MPKPAADEALRRELEATVSEYRASLGPRIAALEDLRGALAGARALPAGAAEMRATLHRELHSIAGSGRTFGLAGVSEAARAAEIFVEQRCTTGATPDASAWEELKALLQHLAAVSKAAAP
jgi:HPt (histidine-containing phosphotransfer) domain-containing protein